jgi:hypothetical protein
MNRKSLLVLSLVALPAAALAQPADILPEYGTLAASPELVVFTGDVTPGQLIVCDPIADTVVRAATDPALTDTGAIGFISGTDWLFGKTSDAAVGGGDYYILDAAGPTFNPAIANLTDIRDLAVLARDGEFDAIVIDRANDTVNKVRDITGTPSAPVNITPTAAGAIGIQGLSVLSPQLYFLYDELPGPGFGDDELVAVEGPGASAAITRTSWNTIGAAGAGIGANNLSVNFHNGLAARRVDQDTIELYLSNFGAFGPEQVVLVEYTATINDVFPTYGSLASSPDSIVHFDQNPNDLIVSDPASQTIVNLGGVTGVSNPGALDYVTGSQWLVGLASDAPSGGGDVYVLDAATATIGAAIANLTDVRDLAVTGTGPYDAFVIDRANDAVNILTDVLGTPGGPIDVTPISAGFMDIQGLAVASPTLYFLYDAAPGPGFGDDELIVVDGNTTAAAIARYSWNTIGSSGAGLSADELSVNFHNGLVARQTSDTEVKIYLSNFGAFSANQVIEVTLTDTGSGFTAGSLASSVLFTQTDLFNAVNANADSRGTLPAAAADMNAQGVVLLEGGAGTADDKLGFWVDANAGNTYFLVYDIAGGTWDVVGNDSADSVIGAEFDFANPVSSVLFTQTDLLNAVANNNGANPDPTTAGQMNANGVVLLKGTTPATDKLAVWIDDEATTPDFTYIGVYDIAGGTWNIVGDDALETILDTVELTITPAGPGQVTISWAPDSPGWVLQETTNLQATSWVDSESGSNNPVTVPVSGMKFYRLTRE